MGSSVLFTSCCVFCLDGKYNSQMYYYYVYFWHCCILNDNIEPIYISYWPLIYTVSHRRLAGRLKHKKDNDSWSSVCLLVTWSNLSEVSVIYFQRKKRGKKNVWPQCGRKDQWIQDQMNKGMTAFWIVMHSWVHNVTITVTILCGNASQPLEFRSFMLWDYSRCYKFCETTKLGCHSVSLSDTLSRYSRTDILIPFCLTLTKAIVWDVSVSLFRASEACQQMTFVWKFKHLCTHA